MPSADKHHSEDNGHLGAKSVTRREFLKIAGIAGATVGASAGLGGLLAACGGTEETTTTTVGATTSTGPGHHHLGLHPVSAGPRPAARSR